MNKELLMQFVGFESKLTAREYTFTVWETDAEQREFKIAIALEAFNARRVRFQDAPDICALKLRSEFATHGNHPPKSHFKITDAELEDYRSAHTSPRRRRLTAKPGAISRKAGLPETPGWRSRPQI